MSPNIRIEPELRKSIVNAVQANINLCYGCGSCVSGCPVNIATNRLFPRKLAFMANLGLLDELVQMPEIWYCLTCDRCNHLCPMTVKPASLIRYLRWEAVRCQHVAKETQQRYKELCSLFPRILWHAASRCLNGQSVSDILDKWPQWLKTPTKSLDGPVVFKDLSPSSKALKKSAEKYISYYTDFSSCFTCCECSSACPICYDRSVFEPLWIFRMTGLGLTEELLKSPSIWLCIDCQSCTNACSQGVKGHLLIHRLQDLAVEEGFVDNNFLSRWREIRNALYTRFLEEIDTLFGFPAPKD